MRVRDSCFVGAAVVVMEPPDIRAFASGTALAQSDPNPGAVTLTAGVDFPTVYFFRGIRQETDPELTTFAYGDVGIALFSNDQGQSLGVNFGVWNSLHTGSSGTGTPDKRSHYEEDFYAILNVGVGSGVTISPFYTAYTSPNRIQKRKLL